MSAIFGFTFHIGRMTEVLTPDIYIELTGVDTLKVTSTKRQVPFFHVIEQVPFWLVPRYNQATVDVEI